MKKLFALLAIAGMMSLSYQTMAQDEQDAGDMVEETADAVDQAADSAGAAVEEAAEDVSSAVQETTDDLAAEVESEEPQTFNQVIKEKFIEGGVTWMTPVLICLILGLAIAIERIITLNMATTNTDKLLANVEDALANGGVEAAKEVTRNTKGPVASIFTQGLMRMSEGIEMVEKSIIAYGSVEMGRLERGLVWISLFIALAPMLGFTGTVIGMIAAFDSIEAAGDISPQIVANGIKVALLTTVAGLIVGIILQ
ncbi:MAG: MotA/TolQ/ExbB proton channel family protein, partial [Cyclobacteriaceae bacterium]